MTEHFIHFHRGEDPQSIVRITILDQAETLEEITQLELIWTRRLFAFSPTGLNVREEEHFNESSG